MNIDVLCGTRSNLEVIRVSYAYLMDIFHHLTTNTCIEVKLSFNKTLWICDSNKPTNELHIVDDTNIIIFATKIDPCYSFHDLQSIFRYAYKITTVNWHELQITLPCEFRCVAAVQRCNKIDHDLGIKQ